MAEVKFLRVKYDAIFITQLDILERVPKKLFECGLEKERVINAESFVFDVFRDLANPFRVGIPTGMEPLGRSEILIHTPFCDE